MPQDLLRILRRSYTQNQRETTQEGAKPQYATISHLYAVREWLLPHMKQIHGLYSFHSFVIERNEDGKAVLNFKAWCTSQWDAWNAYHPVVLLDGNLPEGVPDIVKPNYEVVDFNRLRSMVEKCVRNGIFNSVEEREWMAFFEEEERTASVVYDRNDGEFKGAHLC